MNQLLSIVDDKLVIEKLRLTHLEGAVLHSGSLEVVGAAAFNDSLTVSNGLKVTGTAEIDYLKVKNLVTDDARQLDAFTFSGETPLQLEGKGLLWNQQDTTYQFVLKNEPRRIWSSESIDLYKSATYQIGGVDVVLSDRLGNSILHSSLRSVGVLDSLKVRGNVTLADTAYLNNSLGRLGLNTDQPNGTLSVVDGLVEVIISSYKEDQAFIGTWGNAVLNIGTDNTSRLRIQGNNFAFGSVKSQDAHVTINGSLEVGKLKVNELVADTRIERSTPVEFVESNGDTVYGKGLLWKGKATGGSLILVPNPNRIQVSEHISLNPGKEFIINGNTVLSETALGATVTTSNLTRLGELTELTVTGPINLSNAASINNNKVTINSLFNVANDLAELAISTNSISTTAEDFKISVQDAVELAIYANGNIQLGDKENTGRTINAYGKLAVNVSNPREDSAFEVNGNVVINGRKQAHRASIPLEGVWAKGDIVWNSEPEETSYIGWVCTMSGTPGTWKPFGYIGER